MPQFPRLLGAPQHKPMLRLVPPNEWQGFRTGRQSLRRNLWHAAMLDLRRRVLKAGIG